MSRTLCPSAGHAADADLVEDWPELAGYGDVLADVLRRVPTGQLVVLGEPGAGKTVLLVQLLLDLVSTRPAGGPVPILLTLAPVVPTDIDARRWVATQLAHQYTALGTLDPEDGGKPSRAHFLTCPSPPLS